MAAAEQHRRSADFPRPRPPVLADPGADAIEIFDLREMHAAEPAFGDGFDRRLKLAVVELLEAHEGAHAGFIDSATDREEVLGSEADRLLDDEVLAALRRRDRFRRMGVVQRADRNEVAPRFIQHAAIVGVHRHVFAAHGGDGGRLDLRPQRINAHDRRAGHARPGLHMAAARLAKSRDGHAQRTVWIDRRHHAARASASTCPVSGSKRCAAAPSNVTSRRAPTGAAKPACTIARIFSPADPSQMTIASLPSCSMA